MKACEINLKFGSKYDKELKKLLCLLALYEEGIDYDYLLLLLEEKVGSGKAKKVFS